MKKLLRWAVINAFFASCLWFGYAEQGALYTTGLVMAWVAIVCAIMVCFHDESLSKMREAGYQVPMPIDIAFDSMIIYMLFYQGAVFTAAWYGVHVACLLYIRYAPLPR